jgi:amidohydrolase
MDYKQAISIYIDQHKLELIEVSTRIHQDPELGHQEYKASKLLTERLKEHGYETRLGVSGMNTAFMATLEGSGVGPCIGILAEYDALPGIGHACGHNLIAAAALGAAIGLSSVIHELDGTIIVYGTPAEEGVVDNAGGKVLMLDEISLAEAALMIHPSSAWSSYSMTNARESFLVEFHGRSSHAGAAPEKAVNALEGVLLTFQGINALRQHIDGDVRIHGIIKCGGDSPNTIPDYASAHLYVRAPTMDRLEEYYSKVKNIVRGAELATGAKSNITQVANTYANKLPNKTLSDLYRNNMSIEGVEYPEETEPARSGASTDFGNVSQLVPALSANVNIGDVILHSPDGALMTATSKAHESTIKAAKALAYTALDLIINPGLLKKAKDEHKLWLHRQVSS